MDLYFFSDKNPNREEERRALLEGAKSFDQTKIASSHKKMFTLVLAIVVALLGLWLIVRPRKGGPKAPPMVLSSPIMPIPYIGMAIEFGKSPVKMVRRCLAQYGPVFTVPVRTNST
jgi:bacteriorhodopsin